MKNQQRPVARAVSDGKTILLHSMFPTIQGEGPFAGRPALFVRLAGCNLQCPACDTEYTSGATEWDVYELAERIRDYEPHLVVITGGEPFRQNLFLLIEGLLYRGAKVQVETNGMFAPQGHEASFDSMIFPGGLCVVVSPKTHKCWPGWSSRASAFKYVVADGDVAPDGLPIHALGHPVPAGQCVARPPAGYSGPVYVQPQDDADPERNRAHEQQAVRSVLMDPQRRVLCLQIHKIVGLD